MRRSLLIKAFNKKTGKDMSKDKRALQKLRREVEKAKRGGPSIAEFLHVVNFVVAEFLQPAALVVLVAG